MLPAEVHQVHRETQLRVWHCREELRGRSTAHRGIEVTWIARGAAHYRIGSTELDVGPGHVIVIPAGVDHTTRLARFVDATVIELGQTLMDEIAATTSLAGRRFERACVIPAGEGAGALIRALVEEARISGEGRALAVEGLLDALAVRLLRLAPARPEVAPEAGRDPRILAAIDLLRSRLQDELSIEDLARAAGMSRFHFSRRFRAATGVSPYAFVLRARVTRAAELLRRGRCSVTQASFESGFRDMGRFRRAFRAVHGVNPGDYLARVRDGGRAAGSTTCA